MKTAGAVLGVLAVVAIACSHVSGTTEAPSHFPIAGFIGRSCPPDECKRCDVGVLARERAVDGARDCGWSRNRSGMGAVAQCALDSAKAGRAFVAIQAVQGVDSDLVQAFVVRRDGSVAQLWYDSDVSGGNCACSAKIFEQTCAARLRSHPQDPEALDCETEQYGGTLICDERADAGTQ